MDFGSTAVTGIHVLAVERLREYYGLEKKQVRVIEPFQMLGEIDKDLSEMIGIDVLRLCEILNHDGGFVFNIIHNIQAIVPVKNIVAIIDAAKEFNGR